MTAVNPFHFTDAKSRVWNVSLDLLKVRRVDNSDFSQLTPNKFALGRFDKASIAEILVNTPLLFAVIWAVVQDQVRQKHNSYKAALESSPIKTPPVDSFPADPDVKVEPGQENPAEIEFIGAITGSVIDDARQSFLEALSDFFRDQQTALSVISKMMISGRQKLVEKGPEFNRLVDEMIDKELTMVQQHLERISSETPGTESTASPQSPDGNPTTSTDQALDSETLSSHTTPPS